MCEQDVRIGSILHGYCNGYFGRDGYGCKRVEAVGADWLVARYIRTDEPTFTWVADWAIVRSWLTIPDYCNHTPDKDY